MASLYVTYDCDTNTACNSARRRDAWRSLGTPSKVFHGESCRVLPACGQKGVSHRRKEYAALRRSHGGSCMIPDTQRAPGCPLEFAARLGPRKRLGVGASSADPMAGCAAAFAAWGRSSSCMGGGGGGCCVAPPPPLRSQPFATAPWLPLRWQSTNVPPPGKRPRRAVWCTHLYGPTFTNPVNPPPPPAHPLWVRLLHWRACPPPPLSSPPSPPLLPAPFCLYHLHLFLPYPLGLLLLATTRGLPLALALCCRLLLWQLCPPPTCTSLMLSLLNLPALVELLGLLHEEKEDKLGPWRHY